MSIQKFFSVGPGGGTLGLANVGGGGADPALLEALKAAPPQVLDQVSAYAAQPSSQGIEPIISSPRKDAYGDRLVNAAFGAGDARHPLEGIGRIAQLVGGYYQQSKADAREGERTKAVLKHLQDSNPEAAELYALGDDKTRASIARGVVSDRFASAREKRAAQRELETMERKSQHELEMIERREEVKRSAEARSREGRLEQLRAAYPDASDEQLQRFMLGVTPKSELKDGRIITTNPVTGEISAQPAGGSSGNLADESGELPQYFDNWETIPPHETKMREEAIKSTVAVSQKAHRDILESHQTSSAALQRIEAIERAVEGGIGYSGAFANYVLEARKTLVGMGLLDPEETSNAEVVKAMGTLLAPTAKQGLPGAVSNMEMKLFMEAVPGLMQTPEGMRKIVETFKSFARRSQIRAEVADEWRQFRAKQGKPAFYAEGFESFYRQRASEISTEESKKIEGLLRSKSKASDEAAPGSRQEALARKRGQFVGRTATNPKTGERIREVAPNKWEPY